MALMIGALHRARLCRHAESHTAEGRQHEANNQYQNQSNSTHDDSPNKAIVRR